MLRELAAEVKNFMEYKMNAVLVSFNSPQNDECGLSISFVYLSHEHASMCAHTSKTSVDASVKYIYAIAVCKYADYVPK